MQPFQSHLLTSVDIFAVFQNKYSTIENICQKLCNGAFFTEMAERHDAKAVLNLARNIVRKLQEVMHPTDH